jgi:hypothetical protein
MDFRDDEGSETDSETATDSEIAMTIQTLQERNGLGAGFVLLFTPGGTVPMSDALPAARDRALKCIRCHRYALL